MAENKRLVGTESGRFTDVTDSLLPLFSDPDGRGSRRWREMFGLERPTPITPPRREGLTFSVRVRRQSSSDW